MNRGDIIFLARPILTPLGEHLRRGNEGIIITRWDPPQSLQTEYVVRFFSTADKKTVDVICFDRDFQEG